MSTKVRSFLGGSTSDLDLAPDPYLGCNIFDLNLGSSPSPAPVPISVSPQLTGDPLQIHI